MRDQPGIAIDALQMLFGTPVHESDEATAYAAVGATIIYEIAQNIDAIVKGLSGAGK